MVSVQQAKWGKIKKTTPYHEICSFKRHQGYIPQYTHNFMQTILQVYVVINSPNPTAFVSYLSQVIFCLTIAIKWISSLMCWRLTAQQHNAANLGG